MIYISIPLTISCVLFRFLLLIDLYWVFFDLSIDENMRVCCWVTGVLHNTVESYNFPCLSSGPRDGNVQDEDKLTLSPLNRIYCPIDPLNDPLPMSCTLQVKREIDRRER
jgi:hypothetical protein